MFERKVKVKWGGNRHDFPFSEADENFQVLVNTLEAKKELKIVVLGKHDWGIGIPAQESGYDITISVFQKLGWGRKKHIFNYIVRLDFRKKFESKFVFFQLKEDDGKAKMDELNAELKGLGYKFRAWK